MAGKPNQVLPGLSGTSGLPLLGDLPRLLPGPLPFIKKLHSQYGNIFYARFALNRKSVFVLGPEATEQVLVTKADSFSNALGYADQSRNLGKESILFRGGTSHTALRRAINPAFATDQLIRYVTMMDNAIQEQIAYWRKETPLLPDDINLITLRIAARSIVGVQLKDEAQEINEHIVKMLRSMTSIVPPMPGNRKWRGLHSRSWVQAFLRKQINQRRNQPGDDVFSLLCNAEIALEDRGSH